MPTDSLWISEKLILWYFQIELVKKMWTPHLMGILYLELLDLSSECVMNDETLKLDVHIIKVFAKVSQSMGVVRLVSNMVLIMNFTSFTMLLYIHASHMKFVRGDLLILLPSSALNLWSKNNINAQYSSEQTWSLFSPIRRGLELFYFM